MAVLRNHRPPRMHPGCTDPLLKGTIKIVYHLRGPEAVHVNLIQLQYKLPQLDPVYHNIHSRLCYAKFSMYKYSSEVYLEISVLDLLSSLVAQQYTGSLD